MTKIKVKAHRFVTVLDSVASRWTPMKLCCLTPSYRTFPRFLSPKEHHGFPIQSYRHPRTSTDRKLYHPHSPQPVVNRRFIFCLPKYRSQHILFLCLCQFVALAVKEDFLLWFRTSYSRNRHWTQVGYLSGLGCFWNLLSSISLFPSNCALRSLRHPTATRNWLRDQWHWWRQTVLV